MLEQVMLEGGGSLAFVLVAAVLAGVINTVVGSGSLLTFPALLLVGLPALQANMTNTLGLVAGSVSGAWGSRRELAGTEPTIYRLMLPSGAGAVIGAFLLLTLPPTVFQAVVPILIVVSCILVAFQPYISSRASKAEVRPIGSPSPAGSSVAFVIGIYGGYFGAAQGILLIATLGLVYGGSLHWSNAAKNVLQAVAVVVASSILVFAGNPSWPYVGVIAIGSTVGALIGARIAPKISPGLLRGAVIVIGVVTATVWVLR